MLSFTGVLLSGVFSCFCYVGDRSSVFCFVLVMFMPFCISGNVGGVYVLVSVLKKFQTFDVGVEKFKEERSGFHASFFALIMTVLLTASSFLYSNLANVVGFFFQ